MLALIHGVGYLLLMNTTRNGNEGTMEGTIKITQTTDADGNVVLGCGTRSVVIESQGSTGYTATAWNFPGCLARSFKGSDYYKTQKGAIRAARTWLAMIEGGR